MKEIKVAILGFGGIAKSHKRAYEILAKEGAEIKLVAVCDIDESKFSGASVTNLGREKAASLDGINTYTNDDEMLKNEELDVIDICLPSYLHKDYAIKMMKMGKDVLSEKPMALSSGDAIEMIKAAEQTHRRLMIGQCLRFEPSYLYLKEIISDSRFGKLRHLSMYRLSAHPTWGYKQWFTKTELSGGCIMDLHIHDIDMARFLLGEPKSVSAVAYDGITRWQVVNSRLFYDGVTVIANASWDEADSVKFSAGYRARFESASVILDDKGVTVYPDGDKPFVPEIEHKNRIAEEIRLIAKLSANRDFVNTTNSPESAAASVRLIEKLRESAAENGKSIKI